VTANISRRDRRARIASRLTDAALSVADPNVQALAWETNAQVATAEMNWRDASQSIDHALAALSRFDAPTFAWRVYGTASDLYRRTGQPEAAAAHRAVARTHIATLVNSFERDEPLRHIFLSAAPIRRIQEEATASSAKHDFVRELGAQEVIDYQAVDFVQAVTDVDVVLETIGWGYRSLRVRRPDGLLVTIVERRNMELAHKARSAGKRFAGVVVEPDHNGLEALSALVQSGKLQVHVEHVFRLTEVAQAHRLLTGRTKGKIVLTI
jgi:hypothetical protein